MVDHSARTFVRLREHHHTLRLCAKQADKIQSVLARSYTDDTIARMNAMPVTGNHARPGLRDDESSCTFAVIMPTL